MSVATHIRIWVALAALSLFLSPFLRSGESMMKFVQEEVAQTSQVLGPRFGGWVIANVDRLFDSPAVAAMVAVAKRGTTSQERQKEIRHGDRDKGLVPLGEGAAAMASAANSFYTGFILACYILCIRLLIVLVWFGLLSPVLAAAITDGFTQRAIRYHEFAMQRPAAFSLMALIVVPVAFGPLLYLTIPMSISPAIVPALVCLACMPLALLIAHAQPVFGRH